MSGVNVLAVIDEVSRFHDNGSEAFDSLREARSAVAELIEACDSLSSDPHAEDWQRLYSALSRVRGAA